NSNAWPRGRAELASRGVREARSTRREALHRSRRHALWLRLPSGLKRAAVAWARKNSSRSDAASPVFPGPPRSRPSSLDADVHARRHVQAAQSIHRLAGRLGDVDESLVRADLELLARLLVDERRAQPRL